MKRSVKDMLELLGIAGGLFLLAWLSQSWFVRFDLTEDQRFTLSDATTALVEDIDEPLLFVIYLDGDLPSGFERLKAETKRMLEEFQVLNSKAWQLFRLKLSKWMVFGNSKSSPAPWPATKAESGQFNC
jgi:hypothetical protein